MISKFCFLPLLLAAALCSAGVENVLRRPDVAISGRVSRPEQLKFLTDGSLDTVLTTGNFRAAEFTITLPEAREIDYLVLHTGGGPDWSIAKRIALSVDGEELPELCFPNHFNFAERFDVKRRGKVITLKVLETYPEGPASAPRPLPVKPWGGFAEIELYCAAPDAPPAGWFPASGVSMTAEGTALRFRGKPESSRIAVLAPPLKLTAGSVLTVSADCSGTAAKLQLALFEDTPEKKYVTTLSHTASGEFRIPAGKPPFLGTLQLNSAASGEADVVLRKLNIAVPGDAPAAIPLASRWKYRHDNWTRLGDYDWTKPGVDDSAWKDVPVPGDLNAAGEHYYYGLSQYRTAVKLRKSPGDSPSYRLKVGKISGDDKAFFNGVEVGSLLGIGVAEELRPDYPVPARLTENGENTIAVEVAQGYKNPRGIYAGPVTLTPFGNREYALLIRSEKPGNLFLKGERVELDFEILAGAKPADAVPKLNWILRDCTGRIIGSGSRFVPLASGGGNAALTLDLPQTGCYELEARLTGGAKLLAEGKSSIGVLYDLSGPRGPLDDSPFGMNPGAAIQRKISWYEDFPLLALAGVDHIRMDINWDIVENEKGKYDWTVPDCYAAAAKKHNLRLVPILVSVPLWNNVKSAAGAKSEWSKIYCAPDDLAPWTDFVAAMVARYKDGIREWEIWNEPNHGSGGFWRGDVKRMCELIRLGSAAAKRSDPTCSVLAPGMAQTDPAYLRKMGAEGALSSFDMLSYHPYRHNVAPESADNSLCPWDVSAGKGTPYFERDELLRTMREFGAEKPLVINEFGWSIHGENMALVTPLQQAEYLVRYYAMMIPSIRRIYWYEFRNRVEGIENMAILRADKTPLPAYVAYNVMVHFLRDAKFTGEHRSGGVYCIGYRKGEAPVSVLWSANAERCQPVKAVSELIVYDLMGVEQRRIPAGSIELLRLDGSPLYVTGGFELLPLVSVSPEALSLVPGGSAELAVNCRNPFDHPLGGILRCDPPSGLRLELDGAGRFFDLKPGETCEVRGRLFALPTAGLGGRTLAVSFEFNDGWRIGTGVAACGVTVDFPAERKAGYLRNWLLAGPFAAPRLLSGGPGGEAGFDPAAGDDLAGRKWFVYNAEAVPEPGGYPPPGAVDFAAAGIRGDNSVACAFLRIKSPEKRKAVLRLGSDDGVAAWLNGREVFRNETTRGISADQDAVEVELDKGWNRLLLKISNRGLGWGFLCRLTTLDGRGMTDLEYSTDRK